MKESSQESSPITQWREKVRVVNNKLFRGGLWTSGEDLDPSTFMTQSEATEAITSATIELIEGLIGEDEPELTKDGLKPPGPVVRNDYRHQLRQSLKEIKK